MRRFLLSLGVMVIGMWVAPGGFAQAAAATLTGETLTGTSITTSTCTSGNNFGVDYESSGTATGPYPGTFSESGTVTVTNGQVTAFSASFTIHSGTTTITGTKSLAPGGTGVCHDITGTGGFNANASYTASIQAPGETTTDSGVSQVSGGTPEFPFIETFVSEPCDPDAQGDQDQDGDSQGCP
jgi:hypothetical protein